MFTSKILNIVLNSKILFLAEVRFAWRGDAGSPHPIL